jgi:hypothetical protein
LLPSTFDAGVTSFIGFTSARIISAFLSASLFFRWVGVVVPGGGLAIIFVHGAGQLF